jgi:hypothetical protein
MGNKFLRGVAAGLGALSKHRKEERLLEREDERLAKADAFKERELTIREEESALRRQQLKMQNMEAKAKMNHGNLVKTAMASGYTSKENGYGSAPMADAMTKYLNDGRAYRHAGYDETTQLPIWEVGTYETDLETGKVVEQADGKGKWKALRDVDGEPLKKTFKDENDWLNFTNSNMKPDYMFALQAEERSYAKTEQDHKDRIRRMKATKAAELETEQGAAALSKTKQTTKTDKAREELLRAQAKAEGDGKGKDSKVKQMEDKEFAARVDKAFPNTVISPAQSKLIAHTIDSDKARKGIAANIDKVLSGEMTRAELYKGYSKLPQAYLDRLIERGEIAAESEDVKPGSDKWFSSFVSSFVNMFD